MKKEFLRPLIAAELDLIRHLLSYTNRIDLIDKLSSGSLVGDLSDDGMGSLRFDGENNRVFSCELVSAKYKDSDGVEVIVSIYLDHSGMLFELDSWKVDYSPRLRHPIAADVTILNF